MSLRDHPPCCWRVRICISRCTFGDNPTSLAEGCTSRHKARDLTGDPVKVDPLQKPQHGNAMLEASFNGMIQGIILDGCKQLVVVIETSSLWSQFSQPARLTPRAASRICQRICDESGAQMAPACDRRVWRRHSRWCPDDLKTSRESMG